MELNNTYLITPGGSGTLLMYDRFGKENLCGGVDNFTPHQRFTSLPEGGMKIIYLMAHPLNILLSFENRQYLNDIHTANLQGDENAIRRVVLLGGGLDQYEKYGVNCYDFAGHFIAWFQYALERKIKFLFVKYEAIPKYWDRIQEFIGLKAKLNWQERNSNYKNRDWKNAHKIHDQDIELYNSLPEKIELWNQELKLA